MLANAKLLTTIASIAIAITMVLLNPGTHSITSGLVIVVITLWVTGIIAEYLTAFLMFAIAMLFSIAPASVVFSGFHSAAFWLVFSGLVIGVGINSTGLGKRIAGRIAAHLSDSYFKLISGLVLLGTLFGVLMPSSMGRIILLIPIALAVASHFRFHSGSNGYIGVVMAITMGAFIPTFAILPANVPNMILAGMSESLYQYSPQYGEYLVLHFPLLGLPKIFILVALIMWLYPDTPKEDHEQPLNEKTPITKNERVMSLVLILMILLWLTDFIHHISPAWVALGGAIFLLLPTVNIVSNKHFTDSIPYHLLFFVAGILGLGSIISYSGIGDELAQYLVSYLPLNTETPFINYLSLSLLSMVTGIIVTLAGVPAVLTPLAENLATATGLPIKSVVMTQVIGFSTTFFPYQAPPVLIGLQLANIKMAEGLKVFIYVALISLVLLMPLNYLWWQWLGWL